MTYTHGESQRITNNVVVRRALVVFIRCMWCRWALFKHYNDFESTSAASATLA